MLKHFTLTCALLYAIGMAAQGTAPVIHTVSDYTNATRLCAVVFGQFEDMGKQVTITEYGLCYGTDENPTTSQTHKAAADYATKDDTFGSELEGMFGVYFDNLQPLTTYHVRAYCTYRPTGGTTTTVYGEDIRVRTTGGSGFHWQWEGAQPDDAAAKARIEVAMDSARYYYHNYCNLYKWCGTTYNSGVQTADCSLRSDGSCYIRFGPGERYQWVGTAQHEISHGYGVGQTSDWDAYAKPIQFRTATLTLRVFMRDMTMTIWHDNMHYWPGGINQREEVTNGTQNSKGTYTCRNAEMLKCNALILNAMAQDGMKTTYGNQAHPHNHGTMRYLRNQATGSFLTAANSWGTRASMGSTGTDIVVAGAGEKFSLDTNISNGGNSHYLGANLFLDSDAATWDITRKGWQDGHLVVAISHDGTGYLASPTEGDIVTTLPQSDDPHAQWQMLTWYDLMDQLEKADSEGPQDATFLLPGYNFSRNDGRNGSWKGSPAIGGEATNMVAEKYNTTFDVYQTLTGIPNGTYEITAQGFYRYGGDGASAATTARQNGQEQLHAELYANDETCTLPSIFDGAGKAGDVGSSTTYGYVPNSMSDASAYLSAGLYQTGPLRVTVTDNTLRVGIRKATAVSRDWTIFDNVRLSYLGTRHTVAGDVNDDGQCSIADVTMLVNIILGRDVASDKARRAADLNGDGQLTISDVTQLVNLILQ